MNEEDRQKLTSLLNTQVRDNRDLKFIVVSMTVFLVILVISMSVLMGLMFKNTKDTISTISDKLDEGVTVTIEEVDGTVGDWNVTKEGDIYK